ncbi:Microtubule associated protein [Salix suchowensis]|nr:Microtubule associated protein [Salix suchowensis]
MDATTPNADTSCLCLLAYKTAWRPIACSVGDTHTQLVRSVIFALTSEFLCSHLSPRLQINQLYPADGTPCPKPNQNQPDHLRGLLIEAKDGHRCCSAMRLASPTPTTRRYVRAAGQPVIPTAKFETAIVSLLSPFMAYRGTDNLRCYVRDAGLPPMLCDPSTPEMPPEGHKSHLNHLKIRLESWRKLQTIQELKENRLERSICDWVDKYIPEESLGIEDENKESGEMLSVPCPPTFDIPSQKLRRPADISRLSPWLDNLLLMTTQRIMHILFASTLDWGFHPGNNNDGDKELFDYFLWTKNSFSPEEAFEVGYHSVLVAYQPPWILSPQDMKEFASCRSVCQFVSRD